jgi:hypothetical protein
MTTALDHLGYASMFLGETQQWSLADFTHAAHTLRLYGFTSALVKVANGSTRWYGEIVGGWRSVLRSVKEAGIAAIPYLYSYGRRKYHMYSKVVISLESECEMLAELLGVCGIAVANMHAEYNNKPQWGQDVCRIMREVPGLLGVTTWGFPSWQKWDGVLRALNPRVDFYLPQVYSGFISTIYKRDFNLYRRPYYPVLNLSTDMGPNNIVAIAQESTSPCIAFRQYANLVKYAGPVSEIVGMLRARQEETRV